MDQINDQLHVESIEKNSSNVDSFKKDCETETKSQHHKFQCISNNDSLMEVENCEIEKKSPSNESISATKLIEQEKSGGGDIKDNTKINASNLQLPVKKNIANPIIINESKNQIVSPAQKKNVSLNVGKIAIPNTDALNIKLRPTIMSVKTGVTPSIFTVSSDTAVNPATIATKPVPKLSISEINKIISKPKQGVKITSSKESSNVVLVPHNGVNYVIKNPSKSFLSSSTECSESIEQKKQLLLTQLTDAKTVSKFVARMQKLPDGKYKMLAPSGNLPVGLETLFNQNSHFIKQKKKSNSIKNNDKVNYFIKSNSVSSNNEETCLSENELQESPEETTSIETSNSSISYKGKNIKEQIEGFTQKNNLVKTSSLSSNNEKTNHSETILQDSYERTECMKTSSINHMTKKIEKVRRVLSPKDNRIRTSPVKTCDDKATRIQKKFKLTNDQMNRIGTSDVDHDILFRIKREGVSPEYSYNDNMNIFDTDSNSEKTYDTPTESQKTSSTELSSTHFATDKINHNDHELRESDEKTHSVEIKCVNSVSEEANHVEKKSEESHCIETPSITLIPEKLKTIHQKSQISSEETNGMETSPVNSINDETNNSEGDLGKSPVEISCVKTSSINSITKENDINKKSLDSSQETNKPVISYVNPLFGKTICIQKKSPISSEKIKCLGTPVADPDIIKRIKKEISTREDNSTNTIFKAPDISSFQRHKFIVSRSTAEKRYTMKNISDSNNKVKINAIENPELHSSSRSFIQFLPKSQPTIKKNNQPLIITKYDSNSVSKTNLNPNFKSSGKKVFVKIVRSDGENVGRIIPAEEMKKLFPRIIQTSKVTNIVENQKKNKISPSEDIQKEKKIKLSVKEDDPKFIACKNKYCTSLTRDIIRPELIDNLYCSLACKMLDSKQVENVNKSGVQLNEDSPKECVIDRKTLLEKLKNRINIKRQSLPSCHPKKFIPNVQCDDPKKIEVPCTKPSTIIQSIDQKSTLQIIPKSVEDLSFKNTAPVSQLITKDMKKTNEITSKYLKKFTSAPKKLFDIPFPREINRFKVGHKLEGIDPTHEALFCVLTVVEVCGYRIKLHFDGYPANYDFWVNADNPDLFYTNWCLEHNRILQQPRGYKKNFVWQNYLEENGGAIPAPKINFISSKSVSDVYTHKFHVGRKLEALDKMTRTLSKQLICVATVADVLNNRIRIHFDGWSDDFDYWTDVTSTNLHPIGWCDKNGRNLCPPNGYDDQRKKKPFSWDEYLKETNSKPVSEDAFVRSPLREFSFNMAIEVVDFVVPSLIRIAKVVDVRGNELKILYDGFDSKYAYWIDDDSPDVHPLGWCLKTNHPLEIPSDELVYCEVTGCNGKGNANNLKPTHFTNYDCPYAFDKWEKVISGLPTLPDRLTLKDVPVKKKQSRKKSLILSKRRRNSKTNPSNGLLINPRDKLIQKQKEKINQLEKEGLIKIEKQEIIQKKPNEKEIRSKLRKRQISKIDCNAMMNRLKDFETVMHNIECSAGRVMKRNSNCAHFDLKGRVWPYSFVKLPNEVPNAVTDAVPSAVSNNTVTSLNMENAANWSTHEVGFFVDRLVSLNSVYRSPEDEVKYAGRFINRRIDGKKFLNLSQDYLTKSMKIPLGTALKISNGIQQLRRQYPALVYKDEKKECYRF